MQDCKNLTWPVWIQPISSTRIQMGAVSSVQSHCHLPICKLLCFGVFFMVIRSFPWQSFLYQNWSFQKKRDLKGLLQGWNSILNFQTQFISLQSWIIPSTDSAWTWSSIGFSSRIICFFHACCSHVGFNYVLPEGKVNRVSFSHNANCRLKPLSRLYSMLKIASTPQWLFFF